MSYIIGINLSDRIYLSADTRLTIKDNAGNINSFDDNFCKIEPLSDHIIVAAAGDAKLASFIVNKIISSGLANLNIREFQIQISDFLKKSIDEFLQENPYTNVSLIFGGTNTSAKKKINPRQIIEIAKVYQSSGRGSMRMKDIIFKSLPRTPLEAENPFVELPISDSHIFAIKIELPHDLEVVDVEWGDYIAFGAGMDKKHLPAIYFGEFEVSENSIGQDNIMLTAFLKTTAEENKKNTVGGAVTNFIISNELGSGIITASIGRINLDTGEKEDNYSSLKISNGKLLRIDGKNEYQMKPLKDYPFTKGCFEI